MLSTIADALVAHYVAHPWLVWVETTAVFLALVFFTFVELFKPAGKRRMKNGERPKLPPGPRGVPLLGSMPFLMKGYQDHEYKFVCLSLLTASSLLDGDNTDLLRGGHHTAQ